MSNPTAPDLRAHFSALFAEALRELVPNLPETNVVLEKPMQANHGDYACSIALQLAKQLRAKPRDIAASVVAALPVSPYLEKAEVAGAGFINLFLKRSF